MPAQTTSGWQKLFLCPLHAPQNKHGRVCQNKELKVVLRGGGGKGIVPSEEEKRRLSEIGDWIARKRSHPWPRCDCVSAPPASPPPSRLPPFSTPYPAQCCSPCTEHQLQAFGLLLHLSLPLTRATGRGEAGGGLGDAQRRWSERRGETGNALIGAKSALTGVERGTRRGREREPVGVVRRG